jgi:hypothetical protein
LVASLRYGCEWLVRLFVSHFIGSWKKDPEKCLNYANQSCFSTTEINF